MSKVLVTGGAGYIGSKIVADLIKRKYQVFIIDNLSTGYKQLINKKAHFFKFNIGNKKKLISLFRRNNIQSVVHCAASLDISESEKNPKKYYRNNFTNTKNLLEVCSKYKINEFIFSSTCAVYGNVKGIVTENMQKKPVSIYGKTKLKCEEEIKLYSKKYDFNFAILRYFNVGGSDLKNRIGCINKNNQLLKNLSVAVANKSFKIDIFGKNYNTKDGTCIRDYIHLNDISYIHLKILEILKKKKKSYTLNCGYGYGFSVLDVIKNYEKIFKVRFKITIKSKRKGDIEIIYSSAKNLNKIIKLKNKNRMTDIIKTSVLWEKNLNK